MITGINVENRGERRDCLYSFCRSTPPPSLFLWRLQAFYSLWEFQAYMSSPSLGPFSSCAFEYILTFGCSHPIHLTFSFSLVNQLCWLAGPVLLKTSQLTSTFWAVGRSWACCCPWCRFTLAEPDTWFGSPWYCHGLSARTRVDLWVLGVVSNLFTFPCQLPL